MTQTLALRSLSCGRGFDVLEIVWFKQTPSHTSRDVSNATNAPVILPFPPDAEQPHGVIGALHVPRNA